MRGMKSLTIWALFTALLSQQLFASVASIRFEDEKTYYSPPSAGGHGGYTPTPNCGTPPYDPTPSTPSHTPTPSTPSHTPTPSTPSHTPTHHTPPCNCGTPPHDPSTPSHPSTMVEATKVCDFPCSPRYGTFECFHDCFLKNFKDGNCVNGRCCCTK
ncbi:hypothetical protein Bca4012_081414 [Brassica carinata]